MSVFWDEGRRQLELFCRDTRTPSQEGPSPYNRFIEPDPENGVEGTPPRPSVMVVTKKGGGKIG